MSLSSSIPSQSSSSFISSSSSSSSSSISALGSSPSAELDPEKKLKLQMQDGITDEIAEMIAPYRNAFALNSLLPEG
jgi:hypothetical protein